jgi:hypothetical protein
VARLIEDIEQLGAVTAGLEVIRRQTVRLVGRCRSAPTQYREWSTTGKQRIFLMLLSLAIVGLMISNEKRSWQLTVLNWTTVVALYVVHLSPPWTARGHRQMPA